MKSTLAFAAFLLCNAATAQQCGTYNGPIFRDGFGPPDVSFVEEPAVTLPPENAALALTITAPDEGAVVGTQSVQVYGTYAGPPAAGVAINRAGAVQTANQFVGLVVLEPGSNTITVKLTKLTGETETQTRTITYDPNLQPEVELQAQIQGEHAPIRPTFTLKHKPDHGLVITQLKVDFDGDGSFEIDTPNGAAPLKYTYAVPGFFTASAIVTLDDGDTGTPPLVRTSTRKMAIVPLPLTRQTVCYVFHRMKEKLTANDIPGALKSLNADYRAEWQSEFEQVVDLPTVGANLGVVVDGTLGIRLSELEFEQQTTYGRATKSVTVERASDGVWRITSM